MLTLITTSALDQFFKPKEALEIFKLNVFLFPNSANVYDSVAEAYAANGNRELAIKMLKAKLYELEQDKKRAEIDRQYGEKGDVAWGSQIRSYVFQPYQMVKDHRTGAETSNVQAVMDGDLDLFIQAQLRGQKARESGERDE